MNMKVTLRNSLAFLFAFGFGLAAVMSIKGHYFSRTNNPAATPNARPVQKQDSLALTPRKWLTKEELVAKLPAASLEDCVHFIRSIRINFCHRDSPEIEAALKDIVKRLHLLDAENCLRLAFDGLAGSPAKYLTTALLELETLGTDCRGAILQGKVRLISPHEVSVCMLHFKAVNAEFWPVFFAIHDQFPDFDWVAFFPQAGITAGMVDSVLKQMLPRPKLTRPIRKTLITFLLKENRDMLRSYLKLHPYDDEMAPGAWSLPDPVDFQTILNDPFYTEGALGESAFNQNFGKMMSAADPSLILDEVIRLDKPEILSSCLGWLMAFKNPDPSKFDHDKYLNALKSEYDRFKLRETYSYTLATNLGLRSLPILEKLLQGLPETGKRNLSKYWADTFRRAKPEEYKKMWEHMEYPKAFDGYFPHP